MSGETIKVCCRFRKEGNIDNAADFDEWEFNEETAQIKLREKSWTYDYILNHLTEQDEMYEKVGKQTISDFMNGFNGTIFAYGQSGSGKTFSMLGPEDVTEALSKDFSSVPESVTQLYGITPRAVIQMFEMINKFVSEGSQCTLLCSYIEIYNEKIKCLLSKKDDLKIREQPGMGMNVADKDIRACKTPEEIFEVVSIASKNRAVTGTLQNSRSSRSHTILLMEFEYNGVDGVKRSSRLNLVDLAGCERISKTGVEGAALKEAQKINQSLSTLGMCIMALTTPGAKHIPFRNSKLTLILKESLGGNSKTTLLCTASRRLVHTEESAQTLYFASRAKAIKNSCKSNVQLSAKELQYLVDHMKKEILSLRGQVKKGGLNYNPITDPKLLAMISNTEFEDTGDDNSSSNSNINAVSDAVSDDSNNPRARRFSLINLTEKDIILKYIEMRAKFDNLLESAGTTIYKLSNPANDNNCNSNTKNMMDKEEFNKFKVETDDQLKQIVDEKNIEINSLHEIVEFAKKDAEKKEDGLNKKIQDLIKRKIISDEELDTSKKDYDSLQEMFDLTQNDISLIQEKLNKKKTKIRNFKEEVKTLKSEVVVKTETIEEINKKSYELENKSLESKQKTDELGNKNEMLNLEVENLKNLLKQKEENENTQANKNRELQEEINRHLETILQKEKKINEMGNTYTELEMTTKNEIESLVSKEKVNSTQNESLRKENDNLNKIMQEKITDQSLLNEKEKILNEVKSTLEKRIEDIQKDNDRIKTDLVQETKKFNSERTELSSQLENLSLELKTKEKEQEQDKFELENLKKSNEEKIKLELQKSEQLASRLDNAEKKTYELESSIISLNENEKKLIIEKYNLEKDLKEKGVQIEEVKVSIKQVSASNEKYEKEVKDLKENITEAKNKLKDENESEKKKFLEKQVLLMADVEFKSKKVDDGEIKINEMKAEIKVLQNSYQKSQKRINELELVNSQVRRVSTMLQKESHCIKKETPLNKNIFGVLLKKTDNTCVKEAIKDNEKMQKEAENIFKDKLDEFKKYKQNIISLSPKTVSSRSDIEDIPELDFQDEESFKKAEMVMLEKEKLYNEEKKKKEGMIV